MVSRAVLTAHSGNPWLYSIAAMLKSSFFCSFAANLIFYSQLSQHIVFLSNLYFGWVLIVLHCGCGEALGRVTLPCVWCHHTSDLIQTPRAKFVSVIFITEVNTCQLFLIGDEKITLCQLKTFRNCKTNDKYDAGGFAPSPLSLVWRAAISL